MLENGRREFEPLHPHNNKTKNDTRRILQFVRQNK